MYVYNNIKLISNESLKNKSKRKSSRNKENQKLEKNRNICEK